MPNLLPRLKLTIVIVCVNVECAYSLVVKSPASLREIEWTKELHCRECIHFFAMEAVIISHANDTIFTRKVNRYGLISSLDTSGNNSEPKSSHLGNARCEENFLLIYY